jgi:hypothetical protein
MQRKGIDCHRSKENICHEDAKAIINKNKE